MKGKNWKYAVMGALAMAAGALGTVSHADHVFGQTPFSAGAPLDSLVNGSSGTSINTTQLVWGTSLSVQSLSASTRGQLSVQLTDLAWPDALQSLDLLVTDMNNLWQKLDGPGSLLIDVNGPANLFVAVFARSGGIDTPGLYHLRADFAPVPLPAAAWLLISGLGGLALFRRKTETA